ncbi:hypothetical protein P376_4141 [Streptomyces sp. HCCB10043]|nr:hypothetical protein P376_4141 [Streptomyces sp. HCCB10043]
MPASAPAPLPDSLAGRGVRFRGSAVRSAIQARARPAPLRTATTSFAAISSATSDAPAPLTYGSEPFL